MSSGDRENMFQQPERTDVAQTRQGYGRDNAQIQRHMSAGQFTAKKVADAGADEGAQHFDGASAQQKSESRTCESGSQSQFDRGIESADLFDVVQFGLKLFSGFLYAFGWKLLDKALQTV